jgi:hypothetical protein
MPQPGIAVEVRIQSLSPFEKEERDRERYREKKKSSEKAYRSALYYTLYRPR